MFRKFVREFFFPQHSICTKFSTWIGEKCKALELNHSSDSTQQHVPLLWHILWMFGGQVSGHVWWAQVYSICGEICRGKESVERKKKTKLFYQLQWGSHWERLSSAFPWTQPSNAPKWSILRSVSKSRTTLCKPLLNLEWDCERSWF